MNQQTTLFSNEKLMAMIIPLFLEQLLIMLVGMADTLVVSYAQVRLPDPDHRLFQGVHCAQQRVLVWYRQPGP